MKRRKISLAVVLFALSFSVTAFSAACGDSSSERPSADVSADDQIVEAAAETTTEEPDPFEGFDYGGEKIRVYTSVNDATGIGSSNVLIEGPEEETGDVVSDSAYFRNRKAEELLNVKFEYTQLDNDYTACGNSISKIIMSGDDLYDIIINDLFPLAKLAVQGEFLNVAEAPYVDFEKDYWYKEYMTQLSLDGKKMYQMAGDYFIDVLRSAHSLYFNKNLAENYYGSGDVFYNEVLGSTWTYDKFISYVGECYSDLNGNTAKDLEDQYGLSVCQIWGPSIAFIISADLKYVDIDESGMTLAMNNERSVKLLEKLYEIFYNDATANAETLKSSDAVNDSLRIFKDGRSMFLGYFRLGSFEMLRDMENEVGILPYPKLDETQERYVTSSHDTTEIGVIPVTCTKFDTVCAVLEVLNRETQNIVLPAYYETGLKVKYTRDDLSAQMIDIIHGYIGGSFPLAYGDMMNNVFLKASFYDPLAAGSTDFASKYAKLEKNAQKSLDKYYAKFAEIDH